MKNVLIVDKNLGFLYWLAEALVAAKHQPWPACSVSEAAALLRSRRLTNLDLLILNPSVRGAAQFINRLRRTRPDLKVLAVDPLNDTQVRGANAWRALPNLADLSARQEWLHDIERVFARQKRAA
jgi:CheY-like chemotaxis protein